MATGISISGSYAESLGRVWKFLKIILHASESIKKVRDTMSTEPFTLPEDPDGPQYSENDYRACAIMFLSLLQPAIAHVMAAKNKDIGYAQIMFALGLEDQSMHDVAAKLCVDVACISKGAKEFVRENNLPVPNGMKSEAACKSYSQSRTKQLNQ